MVRLLAAVSGLFCLLILGGCQPQPVSQDPVPPPEEYPIRADWLVSSTPKSVPADWFSPGKPPLVFLDDPHDSLKGDAAELLTDVKAGVFLDTRQLKHIETDPRPLITKGLKSLFGTPGDPVVRLTVASLEEQIASKDRELRDIPPNKKDERDILENELKELQARRPARKLAEEAISELKLDADTLRQGGQLYRNYCQQCHGLTGDGAGPAGKYLRPLPRDYRTGKFKFISTPPDKDGVRARRADLRRTIVEGLDGSAMPSFAALRSEEIDSLVSYVIHLSLRGEAEYSIFRIAADKRQAADLYVDGIPQEMEVRLEKLLSIWKKSNSTEVPIEPDPYTTPDQQLRAAVRGYAVFTDATQGGCISCHIGYGKTAPLSYDDWGGMTRPRNLLLGTYRVSKRPEDLYTRIYCGIPGVGMPSLSDTMLKKTAEEEAGAGNRKWELVHFLRHLSDASLRRKLREQYGLIFE